MSIEDIISRSLLIKHADYLKATKSNGWFTSIESQLEHGVIADYRRTRVLVGDVELDCMVADTPELQSQGLQGHEALGVNEGMVFPFNEGPRHARFHMGSVQFPLDLIFVGDDSRVIKVVNNAEPGTRDQWAMPHTAMVIEVNGGFCRANDIEVGLDVGEIENVKTANYKPAFYDKLTKQNIIPVAGFHDVEELGQDWEDAPERFIDGFVDESGRFLTRDQMKQLQHVTTSEELHEVQHEQNPNYGKGLVTPLKVAQELYPIDPRKDYNPQQVVPNVTRDRFKDHDTPDNILDSQPMDGENYDSQIGYDQGMTEEQQEDIPAVRPL